MQKPDNFYKTILFYLFPFLALLLCLFSRETSYAARNALYLCLDVVIPSLFPFFVLSRLLVPFMSDISFPGFLKRMIRKFFNLHYYTIVIIFLGFLSGYPNGAKMTRDMFDRGLLDNRQASRILPVANNCSPLFIIGTIGTGLFKSVKLGIFLLLIHWISGIIAAFMTGKIADSLAGENKTGQCKIRKDAVPAKKQNDSFSSLLTSSIEEAAILCIKVSGYIVFFAVMSELLSKVGVFSLIGSIIASLVSLKNTNLQEFISAFSRGIIEIASGSQAISQLRGTSLNVQLSVISLFFGFAGFSVHTQIMGIMKGTGCKYRVLFFGKLSHGIIAGIMTFLTIQVIPMSVQTSEIDVVSSNGLLWTRLAVLLIIILSLVIKPYRVSPLNKKSSNTGGD